MKKSIISLVVFLFAISVTAQVQNKSLVDRTKAPSPQPNPTIKIDVPEVTTLDNGLKVIVVENHKLPRVSFQMFVDYPILPEGKKVGLGGIVGQLLSSGTTTLTKDQFDEEIDYMGASVNASARGFFASSLKKHTNKLLELVSDMIKNPAFPQDEMDRIVTQTLSGLESSKTDPGAMAGNVASVVNFGEKHPYGEVTTEKSIKNISLEDVKSFYQQFFMPNISYLVIVGDVSKDEGIGLAKQYFGDWQKGTSPKKETYTVPEISGNQVYFADKPGAVQSVINITHTVSLKPGHPDAIKLSVLNKILGGGGFAARLMANLREDKAYTYGCYSSISPDQLTGTFKASGNFRNEVTDSAIVQIMKEISLISEELVKDEELDLAKKSMTGAFARNLESPQTVAQFALNTIRYNLPADYYQTYLKKLEAVTKEDLLKMAKQYLQPQNLNIVVVGNEEVAEKLLVFDSDGEITYKDHYGQAKVMLRQAPQGITEKTVVENFVLKSLGCMTVTDIPAKLKKIGYIKTVSTSYLEAYSATIEVQRHRAAPNKSAVQTKIKSPMGSQIAQKEWFDGESGGSFAMGGKVTIYEGEELQAKKKESFPIAQMYYFTNDDIKVSLMGIDEVDGKEYYKIKVLRKGSGDFSYEYYALDGGMLEMEESFVKDPDGNVITSIMKHGDYKDVNGITLPHTMEMTAQGQILKFEVQEVIVKKKGKTNAFAGDFD